jgi:diacylglycerol kinase family enzyme
MVRYFVNNSAIGLEPTITLIQQGIQRLRGIFRYLVAALVGIARNPRWSIDMEWEGGEYHGLANLVTIGNCPRTGGIFYMAPHADPYDGLLTFVYGYMRTRMQILQLLPKTMKPGPGNFVEHPAIHEIHSTWLRIHAEPPTPIHTDGEIQAKSIQDVEYRVLPARLPIIAGD